MDLLQSLDEANPGRWLRHNSGIAAAGLRDSCQTGYAQEMLRLLRDQAEREEERRDVDVKK